MSIDIDIESVPIDIDISDVIYDVNIDQADDININVEESNSNLSLISNDINIDTTNAPIDISYEQPQAITIEVGSVASSGGGGEIGDLVTTKDIRLTGDVTINYSGDWISEIIKPDRTITLTNDGDNYTQWEDESYIWVPTYTGENLTAIAVTAK